MSSLRNAVNRRVHRERAQPQERARFGLLEKAKVSAELIIFQRPASIRDMPLNQDHSS